jgi:hypothetical protein
MNKFLFPKLAWFLVLLIPLTFFGFYPSYFSILLSPMDNIYHLHAFCMVLWILMSITQPFLIQQKKIAAHKLIGKISYGIMPLVFITGYLVIRHTYYTNLHRYSDKVTVGTLSLNQKEILTKAAASIDIGLIYFLWLLIFYVLAIINRKKILFHATYMFAAILTLLGPTTDRLIYTITDVLTLNYNFIAQNAVLIFIVFVLFGLCIYQKRNGYSIKPASAALIIYLLGIAVFFSLPNTYAWTSFVELIL